MMVYGGVKSTQNITDFMEQTCPNGDEVVDGTGYDSKDQHFGEMVKQWEEL